ncbi:putative ferric-chelate reductase 1 [Megalops cyprinoides]|uniref:putative ferric-chelate reductase 1 n=1 Tax=Megalops cyprinoides TaxID=118141 RepID=UPI001865404E|nr:putative ferric-chelate reductase 1 [Megalops cyprinoides]
MCGSGVLLLVLVGGNALLGTVAYPHGAVTEACSAMVPKHGGSTSGTNSAPYKVISNSSIYSDGDEITVTLQADSTAFRGFLLQAREVGGSKPVGTFTVTGGEAQLLTCDGLAGSAVSHTSKQDKTTITATWKAPTDGNPKSIVFSCGVSGAASRVNPGQARAKPT